MKVYKEDLDIIIDRLNKLLSKNKNEIGVISYFKNWAGWYTLTERVAIDSKYDYREIKSVKTKKEMYMYLAGILQGYDLFHKIESEV